MNPSSRTAALAATALVTAGAISLIATPAGAATPPATRHCSATKTAGSSGYQVRVCADLRAHKKLVHTAYLKNTGKKNLDLEVDLSVDWHHQGVGDGRDGVTVAPGHSKRITETVKVGTGPYTVSATLRAAKSTASVHVTFTK